MNPIEEIQRLCGILHQVINGFMHDAPTQMDKTRILGIADQIFQEAEKIKTHAQPNS